MTLRSAVNECVACANTQLEGAKPDLAIVMFSSSFTPEISEVVPILQQACPSLKTVIGCSGFGVIGRDVNEDNEDDDLPGPEGNAAGATASEVDGVGVQGAGNYSKSPIIEIEQRPALAISFACLPDVKVRTFTMDADAVPGMSFSACAVGCLSEM